MLGKMVRVIVDRPMGSYHPNHKDLYYPVNCGYIENIIASDGEEQDTYILGVDKLIKEFIGRVVAIIHRNNDTEEKWVVAPVNVTFSKDEILKQIDFQEKYFDITIKLYEFTNNVL